MWAVLLGKGTKRYSGTVHYVNRIKHTPTERRKGKIMMIKLLSPIIPRESFHSDGTKQQPPPVIPLKGRRTTASLVPSLQSLNGSLWALHFFPPDSPRQLIQEGHVALPSYNGVLSCIPHWHALIAMWIVQWWCPSTHLKGNEMSGWVAKVWLPVDGLFFFLSGSVGRFWKIFSKFVRLNVPSYYFQSLWERLNILDITADIQMTCASSLDYFNIILGDFNCGCLKKKTTLKWPPCCPSVTILLNMILKMILHLWESSCGPQNFWTYLICMLRKIMMEKMGRYTLGCMNRTIMSLYSFR